jgi:hypothetical protein
MKTLYLAVFLGVMLGNGFAQNYSDDHLREHPVWIEMMDSPNVNYFEAVRAFELYWEGRDRPTEEEELLGKERMIKEKKKEGLAQSLSYNKEKEAEELGFYHKKFKHWQRINWGYVQPDGHILSPSERLEIWKREKQRPQIPSTR